MSTPTRTAAAQASIDADQAFRQLKAVANIVKTRVTSGAPANSQLGIPAYTGADFAVAIEASGASTVDVILAALAQSDETKLAAALAALA